MKNWLFVILSIACIDSFAQENEYFNSSNFKVSVLRFIDPITPGIELSYEKRYLKKFASELTCAYLTKIVDLAEPEFYHYKGFKISYEEKYFFKERKKLSWYIALNYAFVKNSYFDTITYGGVFSKGYDDEIFIKKETHAVNVKPGFNLYLKHFTLDVSFGGGIKFRNVRHYNVDYPNFDFPEGFIFPDAYYYTDDKERKVNISVAVSIKMGYWF